jgi:hypothetical protein
MNRTLSTLHAVYERVKTDMAVADGGIIDKANALNNSFQQTLGNIGVTVIMLGIIIGTWKSKFALAGFLTGIFLGGLGYWAVNGGFKVIGDLIGQMW